MGAFTELTAAIAARMAVRGTGAIVNIASTGAYAPAPVLAAYAAYAAYAASKAYVLSFTQALWAEMQHANVRVVAVSPGPTQTPMNPSVGGGSDSRLMSPRLFSRRSTGLARRSSTVCGTG